MTDARDAIRWRKFNQAVKSIWNQEKGCINFYLPRSAGGYATFEAAVDALPDPGAAAIDARDDVNTLTVVLARDINIKDRELVLSCLSVVRGVVAVQSNVANPGHYAAVEVAKHDLHKKLLTVIAQDTQCSTPFDRA